MKKGEILYESLPIGRIGIEKDTQEVVVVNDFSACAQMIEEYICFGAVNIIMPSSSPEIEGLRQMPLLLRDRIKIIDDTKEIEIVNRLLHNVRNEFDVKINEETNFLKFPKKTNRAIIDSLDQIHIDVKKMSLGFNHGIQIGFNIQNSIKSLRLLREKVQNSSSRLILAQFEGLLNQYEQVEFKALTLPKNDTPIGLITVFDKLINDQTYLEYSDAINQLSLPAKRENTLKKIKELSRTIGSKSYIPVGWDYLTKIIKVLSGVPLPESKDIAAVIRGKNIPQLVDLTTARNNALEMWKKSKYINNPLRRDGQPIDSKNIHWLPPLDSMKIRSEDNRSFCLGKVGELKKALEEFEKRIERENKNEA